MSPPKHIVALYSSDMRLPCIDNLPHGWHYSYGGFKKKIPQWATDAIYCSGKESGHADVYQSITRTFAAYKNLGIINMYEISFLSED